jgi:hypothetical protein
MTRERGGGPVAMSDNELAPFLAAAPTGALCVVDDGGHLLALPARVTQVDGKTLTVAAGSADLDATQRITSACLVADTFTAYRDIRGVIAQGTVTWPPTSTDVAQLTVTRTVTFSFANAENAIPR